MADLSLTEPSVVFGLLVLAIGLVKVVEKFVDWATEKYRGARGRGQIVPVRLEGEQLELLRETNRRTGEIYSIVSARDAGGLPLVYYSRANDEALRQVASCLKSVAEAQERTADHLEKLDSRLERLVEVTARAGHQTEDIFRIVSK